MGARESAHARAGECLPRAPRRGVAAPCPSGAARPLQLQESHTSSSLPASSRASASQRAA